MIAAQKGQEKLLTAVMVNADVNAFDCHGFTPLHYAAISNSKRSAISL
jgi:ankyrin repeat protein